MKETEKRNLLIRMYFVSIIYCVAALIRLVYMLLPLTADIYEFVFIIDTILILGTIVWINIEARILEKD